MNEDVKKDKPCPVCENDEYTLRSGNYYCTLCQTQSQQLGEEKVMESQSFHELGVRTKNIKLTGASRKKKAKVRRKIKKIERFTEAEKYSIVLKQWIVDLEKLGVCNIRNAVLEIWCLYLKSLDLAFTPSSNDGCDLSKKELSLRDKWLLMGGPNEVIHPRKCKIYLERINSKVPKPDSAAESSGLDGESGTETEISADDEKRALKRAKSRRTRYYRSLSQTSFDSSRDGFNSNQGDTGSESSGNVKDSVSVVSGDVKIERLEELLDGLQTEFPKKKYKGKGRGIQEMLLPQLFKPRWVRAVLVLAVITCPTSSVTASDLAHLFGTNAISYWTPARKFLKKANLTENEIFDLIGWIEVKAIGEEELNRDAFRLASFIKLGWEDDLATPIVFTFKEKSELVLMRYLDELCLPKALISVVLNVFSNSCLLTLEKSVTSYEPKLLTWEKSTLPSVSVRILALILITLKQCFGLDDLQEYYHSHNAKVLNKEPRAIYKKQFDIMEWLYFSKRRVDILLRDCSYLRTQFGSLWHAGQPKPSLDAVLTTVSDFENYCNIRDKHAYDLPDRLAKLQDWVLEKFPERRPAKLSCQTIHVMKERSEILSERLKESDPSEAGVLDDLAKMANLDIDLFFQGEHRLYESLQEVDHSFFRVEEMDNSELVFDCQADKFNEKNKFIRSPCLVMTSVPCPLAQLASKSSSVVIFNRCFWSCQPIVQSCLIKSQKSFQSKYNFEDILASIPANFVWVLKYFASFASVSPRTLLEEVIGIENYIKEKGVKFF